jgi:hypothetical protein
MNRRAVLMLRLGRNAYWAAVMIAVALIIGMVGYVYFGDGITWAGAFADAAMILAGEGPLDQMKTTPGHLFEGFYALISGFLFFAIAGFALAPALHHILRSFHLEDEERAERLRKDVTSRQSHN